MVATSCSHYFNNLTNEFRRELIDYMKEVARLGNLNVENDQRACYGVGKVLHIAGLQ